MDLLLDLKKICLNLLRKERIHLSDTSSAYEVVKNYTIIRSKLIENVKREVFYSIDLEKKEIPEPYNKHLKGVKKSFESGDDINPYLSTQSINPEFNDWLLYDWGVYHLHLGGKKKHRRDKRFYKRSGPLLYFMLSDEKVYFIDYLNHESFSKKEILSIVKRNWPQIIEKYRLPEVTDISLDLSDEEISNARKVGSFYLLKIDGDVYMPTGGGLTTGGIGISHISDIDNIMTDLRVAEKYIRSNKNEIKIMMGKRGINPPKEFNFKLAVMNGEFRVIEKETGFIL